MGLTVQKSQLWVAKVEFEGEMTVNGFQKREEHFMKEKSKER